ncbi:MAG: hypothetical protein RIQ93_3279 [Verrucomicrobiota bacterium]|jgi:hypothetical protein
MKTEEKAWRALRARASAELPTGFAEGVLRATRGPGPEVWRQMNAIGAAQLRPGFAERVLRAAWALPEKMPTLLAQFTLGAATVAVCVVAVLALHTRSTRLEEERALASWAALAAEASDFDLLQ